MKKPELLSPAGNFTALKGAINAGADAIYLGGGLYGARAYADNFTQDEITEGLYFAHLFGKKIYLTVNTLVKEKELDGLYHFLLPFYEKGLDGVIVQDLGVVRYVQKHFPHLPIHASTQMTLTGCFGAELVRKEGISRIVPARELSLEEMKKIKQETGLEIEAFIHGAMCYCYSGQCLFSSILGGRSGNRGRCAQPCRLPYKINGKEESYPLSMRDMCTLHLLPVLIEAGIDSFKIEGRMKKPAYAAGVTAIYRKYIDLYEDDRENYQVDRKDLEVLNSLYIRSEVSDGYYLRTSGREMISISSPAYSATDEKLLSSIENRYIDKKPEIAAEGKVLLKPGEAAELILQTCLKAKKTPAGTAAKCLQDKAAVAAGRVPNKADSENVIIVTCKGDIVQKAIKQPLTSDKIKEQIQKSGNSFIRIEQVEVIMREQVFMPVKALNELRRKAVAALEKAILEENGYGPKQQEYLKEEVSLNARAGKKETVNQNSQLHISVRTREQLNAVLQTQSNYIYLNRIYLEYPLLTDELIGKLQLYKSSFNENQPEVYVAVPYIVREKDICRLEVIAKAFAQGKIDGVLVRNLESYGFLSEKIPAENLVIDAGLYIWNRESLRFWEGRAAEFYLPFEENRQEWKELLQAVLGRKTTNNKLSLCSTTDNKLSLCSTTDNKLSLCSTTDNKLSLCSIKASAVIYGRLPMMVTANCLKKTAGKCNRKPELITLTDRYEKQFPVYTDCQNCYNVIYNSVPLSLHGMFARMKPGRSDGHPSETNSLYDNFRLDFTVEDGEETLKIIRYFQDLFHTYREPFYKEYTTGHYKRGVE